MRWRILRHSLRGRQALLTVLGFLAGLVAVGVTLAVAAADFDRAGVGSDLLAAVYLLWTVGWFFAPILAGGGDETLRPEHFALLPITSRQLAGGLLGAAFVGVPAIVTGLAFLGLAVHASEARVLVAVVAVPLQLVFVVLLSRVVLAVLGAVLRSRRGRDLGILLTAVVGMSGFFVQAIVRTLGPDLMSGDAPVLSALLRWLPSGWGTVAVSGSWVAAVAALVGLVLVDAALLVLWGVLLVRRATRVAVSAEPARRRAFGGRLPATPVGAVVGKELRTWVRDPRRRVALLSVALLGVIMAMGPVLAGDGAPSPFAGVGVVAFGCLLAGNLYGLDGSGLWHTLVAPGAEQVDVRGRQVAWVLLVAPLTFVLVLVLPGISEPGAYPWVLSLAPALLGGGAGLVVLLSVFAAYPMPSAQASPFAAGRNPGLLRVVQQLGIALLLLLVAVPPAAVVFVGWRTGLPVVMWAGVPVGVLVGSVLFWWWGALAGRRLAARGPEVLAEVAKPV
jgi:ABC-2 type transport system permease protein